MARRVANIDYAYQKAVSYSQYSTYTNCQYQWYLMYIKKHQVYTHSIYTIYGTSVHETLQEYLRLMYEDSIKAADNLDLSQYLKDRLVHNYKEALEENGGVHFSKPDEMKEFLADGQATLEWFKKHRARYFSKKGTHLVGIEVPILLPVTDEIPNVILQGYVDFILYDKDLDKYTIYDIKTSTRGWSDKEKKDQTKINQILLYKKFYSKGMGVPEDKIDVKFFIVKRKVFTSPDFPIHRVQEFVPANGKRKVQDAHDSLVKFIKECFTPDAKYNTEREYPKSLDSCRWCPFKDKPDLCSRS